MKSKPPVAGYFTTRRNGYAPTRLITALGVLAQMAKAAAVPLMGLTLHLPRVIDTIVEEPAPEDVNLLLYLGIAAILVLLGGAFAGLTIA
jgi:metal transporter CNNM